MALPLQNAEGLDWVVAGMEAAQIKVASSAGKRVKLQQAELDFLKKLEACRTFMEAAVKKKADHAKLLEMVGGDACRIARARAVIEAATLSEQNSKDSRLDGCKRALDGIEETLKNLGMAELLETDQKKETAHLLQRQETLMEDFQKATAQVVSAKKTAAAAQVALIEPVLEKDEDAPEEPDPVKVRAKLLAEKKRMSLSDWLNQEETAPKKEVGSNYDTKVRMLLVLEEEDEDEEDDDA